jgi:hypothetical protein
VVDVEEVWVSEMHVRGMSITERSAQSAVILDHLSGIMPHYP